MTGFVQDLLSALRVHFGVLVEDVEGLVVVYPNEDAEPPADPTAQWLRVTILPGERRQVELGQAGLARTRGVLVVGVYSPLAIGSDAQWALVDRVNVALRTTSTADFTIEEPVPSLRRRDGAWWRVDVSCPFYADEAP